ncbi:MAG: MobC family plasmid mobilization relaxosome protein [Gammaproteobacteria bacterium]|nr:MAG: MobC family plasmid mobilization relaxosome protein [Gammaproteobacteria bacterium]
MTKDAFIACRVTPETKARMRALAQREGIAESALIKQLLDVVLRASAHGTLPAPEAPQSVSGDARFNVRLGPEISRLLRERAKGRGTPSATYIASLVRAHFLDAAPLPKAEYVAIKQAVGELSAIGRNLNQIARAINQGGRPAPPGGEDVMAMLKVAEALRDHIKALVSANTRAWGTGHAQKPH